MNSQIFTLGTIRDYILKNFPNTLWWDGFHKHEQFNKDRAYKHRQGLPNEIRIEFDYNDENKSWEAINFTGLELLKRRYSFALFYVEGGRSPHIHIYNLDELEELDLDQRKIYREEFLKSVCGEYEADLGLCDEKHLCALEFVTHFKHGKPKRLISYFDNGYNQGIELDIKLNILRGKIRVAKPIKKDYSKMKFGDMLRLSKTDIIIKHCSFEKVFDNYGVKYKGTMALCPFHADTNYSLSFSNEKALWNCFGCDASGNVFTLIKKLRGIKNG